MYIGFNRKKEMIAMLLAGGEGNRLHLLTRERAKPAVPFGGRYRIIDFTLSNCTNSGIDTVGVLTQYRPMELHSYIGNGQPWDLDRMDGGVSILPPYTDNEGAKWYKGTANAICQNINFVEQYSPEYVLILSGDHIYKMDYAKMLAYHKERNADATIAVLDVPFDEAKGFGIMELNDDMSIRDFEEKPENPKSTKASMGVYIFTWKKLKEYLINDNNNPESSHDFGKNIIPAMLGDNQRVMAYQFDGYWKDVGTISNLWDANMDLLNPKIPLHLSDPLWRIYSRHYATGPHYIGNNAHVNNSIITEGCRIGGNVNYSVLFSGVQTEAESDVEFSVVMGNTKIAANATVRYAIVSENVIIEPGAVVGCPPELYSETGSWGIAVIGSGAVIKSGQVVLPNQMVGAE